MDRGQHYQNNVQVVTPQERNIQTITNITNITTNNSNIEPTIKQQFQQVIKSYKEEDSVFVETEAYKRARNLLVNNHFLTLIGKPGSGKTSIARHLLISFLENKTCEESVLVTSPDDWKKLVDVKKKQFVLIENIFGFTNLSKERLDLWGSMLDIIHRVLLPRNSKLFVVFTCRHHILMDAKKFLEDNNLFVATNVINLTDPDLLLTIQEKREILLKHVKNLREDEIRTIVKCPLPHGYPYCCRMFATNISFRKRGPEFFEKPKEYIKEEINLLRMTDKVKFCVLVLCMLNDGHVSKSELDFSRLKKHEISRLKEVLRVVEVPAETSSFSLIEALENLTSLYLLKTDTVYSFLHPCLLETVADIMAKYVSGEVINLCSWTFIHEKVRTNKSDLNPDSFTILLENDDFEPLAIRLTDEVLNRRIKSIVHHQACADENFIKTWIKTATDNGNIIDLCLTVDVHNRSLLYWAVWSKNMMLFKYFFICCRPNIKRQMEFDEQKSMILLAASFFRLHVIVDIILHSVVEIKYQDVIEPRYTLEKYSVYGFKFGRLLSTGPSILHAAVFGGNVDIVQKLIDYKAPIDVQDRYGGTPLHAAASVCVPEIVKCLINSGAIVNAQDIHGWTPLHIVAGAGYVKDSGNTLEKMFNISNIECIKNDSLNHGQGSMQYKQIAILEIFKQHDASLLVKDYEKDTLLHIACVNNQRHIVEWLLNHGLSVNEQTGCNLTPLHLSAKKGNEDICKLLLDKGADVNASQLKFHSRPIHYAACSGCINVVKIMVSAGAYTEVRNSDNKTALDLAKDNKFHHIVKYLQVFIK